MAKYTVRSFLVEFLKNTARITLADDHGNIFYEGDVMSCSREITRGYVVKSISGLGDLDDIIIVCTQKQ